MKVVTKCWRVCSPSQMISSPANCCSCKEIRKASCFPSRNRSPSNFQGDHNFSGGASQAGLGKLPTIEVGNNNLSIPCCAFRKRKISRSEEHTSELQSRENLVC